MILKFCSHFWIKGLPVYLSIGKGYKHEFKCERCDKAVYRWSGHEPISSSVDPLYENKEPQYNISPPIIYIDRGIL